MSNKNRIQHAFDRAANHYNTIATFQHETANDLLQFFSSSQKAYTPQWILDGGCGTAHSAFDMKNIWPNAQIVGCDLSLNMLKIAKPNIAYAVCSDLENLPFSEQKFDLIWSNLALQWCEPALVFQSLYRVLKKEGFLVFTTLGPKTLSEFHFVFSEIDNFNHVHTFSALESVQGFLKTAGFQMISFKKELRTLFFQDFQSLLLSLRGIGANKINTNYRTSLMGKKTWQKAKNRYESLKCDQGLPLSYELFFCIAKR